MQKLWHYNLDFKIPLLYEGLENPVLLISSKLQLCLLKQPQNTHNKLKELEVTYQTTIYICSFWNRKSCWFPMKNDKTISSFIIVRHAWRLLERGSFLRRLTPSPPPQPFPHHLLTAPKRPIFNRVKEGGNSG